MFKPIQALAQAAARPEPTMDEADVKNVFRVLHGFYGNLFLSKFATGSVENGEDQGIANARRIWAYSLRGYDAETVKLALRRCQSAHPEFPPSCPQFVALCEAVRPRAVWRPATPTQPALAMSEELRAQRRAEARAAATEAAHRRLEELKPTGLAALKQAIADAVSCAGGDEVAMLLRLDSQLAPAGGI